MHEFLDWSHVWRAWAITAICVYCAHRATGGSDDRYRWVGRACAQWGVPLGMEDEPLGIDLHLVRGYHETEIIEKEEV